MAEEHSTGSGDGRNRRRGRSRRNTRNTRNTRNLPEELQEDILRRLPVKSLTRFESVCKTWRSKFHSRPFIDLYGRRHPGGGVVSNNNNNSLEFHTIMRKKLLETATGLKARKINWRRTTWVLGPLSNGIYCLTCHPHDRSRDRFCILSGKIVLCNPTIHDYKLTNPFPRRIQYQLYSIASEPCRLHFGFGKINSSSGDYRVIVIVHYGNPFSTFLSFVYSLQSGKWKRIVDHKDGERNVGYRMAVIEYPGEVCPQSFFQGCWHWAARGKDNSYYVLSFNFADEAFKLIGAPLRNPEELNHLRGSVFMLHDHLAFMYLYFDPMLLQCFETDIHVWMMMEYGVEKSWTRIYKINPNFCGRFLRLVAVDYTLRGAEESDDENGGIRIECLFFEDNNYRVISCDDAGSQICEASGLWNIRSKFFWNTPGISTYVETLERL